MKISEIFHSIQGEGMLVGVPSVFVRVSGCNLRCVWCDTPYASWQPEGGEMTVASVLAAVAEFDCKHVVLTGGEPMIFRDVVPLTRGLRERGRHITIETAGTVWQDVVCDLASVSPKLNNATPHDRDGGKYVAMHEAARLNLAVLRRFVAPGAYQFKFVVERAEDLTEIEALIAEVGGVDRQRVWLMPQGVTREELASRATWLARVCKQSGFRYGPRLHIELFGNTRGT